MTKKNLFTLVLCLFCFGTTTHAQRIPTLEEAVYGGLIKTEGGSNVNWMKDGERYSKIEKNAEGAYEVTAAIFSCRLSTGLCELRLLEQTFLRNSGLKC